MNLTDDDVQEILRLLEMTPYEELKLTTERFTLELKARGAEARTTGAVGNGGDEPSPASSAGDSAAAATHAPGEIVDIYPPLPGTFYRAPSPGATPFTEIGQTVDEESILGLIETMKLMNSVVARCRGEVIEICAENGALVEVDQVLIKVRVSDDG
jgi:acetyl-CoA carboxylase biotin carboxyl carrier protein